MEKLTFTNANAETIEFSGTSKYKWLEVTGLGGTESDFQTESAPNVDGLVNTNSGTFAGKNVTVQMMIESTDLYNDFRALSRICNPRLGVGTLTYTNGTVTRVLPKVKAKTLPIIAKDRGEKYQRTAIMFSVFDPLYQDESFTETEILTFENLFTFELELDADFEFGAIYEDGYPVDNIGDTATPIIAVLDGALTAPISISNETTGEAIVVDLSISAGEVITIDTDPNGVTVTKTASGVTTSAFEFIDFQNTTFFTLGLGENNIKLTTNGVDSENATVKFKNKYVSI